MNEMNINLSRSSYADDLCIIFPPTQKIEIIGTVNRWSMQTGMQIADKSKYFIVNEDESDANFVLNLNGIVTKLKFINI